MKYLSINNDYDLLNVSLEVKKTLSNKTLCIPKHPGAKKPVNFKIKYTKLHRRRKNKMKRDIQVIRMYNILYKQ